MADKIFVLAYGTYDEPEVSIELYATAAGAADRALELEEVDDTDDLTKEQLCEAIEYGDVYICQGHLISKTEHEAGMMSGEATGWTTIERQVVNP